MDNKQIEWDKLTTEEKDRRNIQAFNEHRALISKGICIHDVGLPIYSTTCDMEVSRQDDKMLFSKARLVCQICKEVVHIT